VVSLYPNEASRMPAANSALRRDRIVGQENETFLPLVTVLPVGGSIVFTNADRTMHHVYSFAPIRQFEFVLNSGEKSVAVHFDRAGIAAIGCNIHDQMISYVYVTDSPWTLLTGPDGVARFELPAGAYRTQLWHPEMAPGRQVPSTALVAGNAPAAITLVLPRLVARPRANSRRADY
jgi:plastocyanin